MSEASDRSDVSRSARANTKAPGFTRRKISGGGSAPDSGTHYKTVAIGASTTETALAAAANTAATTKTTVTLIAKDGGYPESPERASSESFSEDRFASSQSNPPPESWEDSNILDDADNRLISSSKPVLRDRRKQFDATTPTLIDEEDDSEMLTFEHPRTNVTFSDKDESLMRRTPGASMYKSSFELTSDDMTCVNKAPCGSVMHGVSGPMPHSDPAPYVHNQAFQTTISREPPGLGFGLSLSTPVVSQGVNEHPNQAVRDRLRQMVWDTTYRGESLQSSSVVESQRPSSDNKTESDRQSFRDTLRSTLNSAPTSIVRSGTMHEHRDPFSIAPWGKGTRDESSQPFIHGREDGRSATTSGAFSPNILRLTEDIGNLLHDDDDDDFAFEIPGIGHAEHFTDIAATGEDWTGSYVFDSEAGRDAAKPAVPSRSSSNTHNTSQHKEGRSRRRAPGANTFYQPQHGSFPNAQQPKPRVRSGDEVFEFGKSSSAESPQVLNFGGAFAPPSYIMGHSQTFRRPVPFLPVNMGSDLPDTQHVEGELHHSMVNKNQTLRGNFQVGISGSNNPSIYSHSFDTYQQAVNVRSSSSGEFFQPQHVTYMPNSVSPSYRMMPGPVYGMHQSEMQATAREFVPRNNLTMGQFAPQQEWPAQEHDWLPRTQISPGPSYEPSVEQTSWHNTIPNQSYSYGYGLGSNPDFGNHRSIITPSPHLPAWSQQQHLQHSHHLPHQFPTQQHELHPQQYPPPQPQQIPPLQPQQIPSLHQQQTSQTQLIIQPEHIPQLQPSVLSQPQLQPQQQLEAQQQPILSPPPISEAIAPYSTGTSTSGPASRVTDMVSHQGYQGNRGMSSPHLSVTGSENSQGTSQRSKKDSKRKPRTKKKAPKADSPGPIKKGPIPPKRKGNKMDQGRSSAINNEVPEDAHVSAVEDPNDAKRSELNESPATRAAFKEFYRAIRNEERSSFKKAEEFALRSLSDGSLPESVHWRVYLELADLSKRSNRYVEARRLYKMVCQLQPYASQGWLEFSKLEEECGNMNRVMNILHSGLEYCKYSESLLTRAVKHQEKMGNLSTARELLARLKHVGIEKVWRTVLEGALLEVRAGNVATARRVLKYLMHHVPWYGPLYLEAYRLEKDQGHPLDALQIVERGLEAIPRYGPLWFGAFRLCEDLDRSNKMYGLPQSMEMIERATVSISKELVWKVHLEAAQMLERSAIDHGNVNDPKFGNLLALARRRLAMTILTCPNNLRWKVWLAAARMELGIGNTDQARSLFLRAHEVVPKKGRSSTLLESARFEDFIGNTDLARAILCKGRSIYGHDWKVWFESVLLETRSGNISRAIEICKNALEIHQGTGRLWATLVQLRQYNGRDSAQQIALRRALNAVPKSGEVWCEGGRIHLNPFSDTFDLARARRHLFFATRFTPQYGDGFVETIRLELIDQWLSPIAEYIWEETKQSFLLPADSNVESSLTKYVTDVALAIAVANTKDSDSEKTRNSIPHLVHQCIVPEVRKRLQPEVLGEIIDLSDLRLACVNADPNYGLLWFHCRRRPTDTPRRIIEDAAANVAAELQKYSHIYLAAIIRRKAVLSTIDSTDEIPNIDQALEITDLGTAKRIEYVDEKLQAAPSLEEIFNPIDPTTGLVLLENTANGPLFVTGLSDLNRHNPISFLSLAERRRSLFGNDALFP